jgi:uncharacterized protein YjbI with pentapeptide repeats
MEIGALFSSSEDFKNYGLVLAAILGLPFLIWRSYSAHKTALSSLKHSEASLKQSEAALRQAQNSAEQAKAALSQAETNTTQTNILITSQFVENIIKAFSQLESENPGVRLGAIYALRRLANDSAIDKSAIDDALTQYINFSTPQQKITLELDEKTKKIMESEEFEKRYIEQSSLIPESVKVWPPPKPDTQAILTYLGSSINYVRFEGRDFTGAGLIMSNFDNAIFSSCDLSGAKFCGASLKNANFYFSQFTGTDFAEAELLNVGFGVSFITGASFKNAILDGASLESSIVEKALFSNASLKNTNLSSVDLSTSLGLTQKQLDEAYGNEHTILPDGLKIRILKEEI